MSPDYLLSTSVMYLPKTTSATGETDRNVEKEDRRIVKGNKTVSHIVI